MWYLTAASLAASNSGGPLTAAALFGSYVALTNVLCGLFLALVFGLGHNGMNVYHADDRPDFWKLQVRGTPGLARGREGEASGAI